MKKMTVTAGGFLVLGLGTYRIRTGFETRLSYSVTAFVAECIEPSVLLVTFDFSRDPKFQNLQLRRRSHFR